MNNAAIERVIWGVEAAEPRILPWLMANAPLNGRQALRLNESIVRVANMNSLEGLREIAIEALTAYIHAAQMLTVMADNANVHALLVLNAPLDGDAGPAAAAPIG